MAADDLPANKALVTCVFEAVIAGEQDIDLEQREDLCRALNAVVAKWRARPVRPTGPDVSGYWLDVSHVRAGVQ